MTHPDHSNASETDDNKSTQAPLRTSVMRQAEANDECEPQGNRYRDLYDLSPIAQATLSLTGEIIEANLTLAALLQTDREQLIGKPLTHWMAPMAQDIWQPYWQELRQGRTSSSAILTLDAGKGTLCHVRIHARICQHQEHVPEYRLAFCEVYREPAPMIYQHALSIMETIRQPLLVLDEHLIVEVANRAFYEAFQMSAEETIGQCIYDLDDGQWDIPALRALIDRLSTHDHDDVLEDYEIEHVFPKIGRRIMVLNARRLRQVHEQQERILLAMEDVSDRVMKERVLEDLNARLTEANQELRMFAYSVSHDLRAPLRSIDGFSQALLEDFGDTLDPAAQSYLGRVRAAVQRMALLIDGLLQLSRIIHAEPQFRLTDLSAMARGIAIALEEREPTRQVIWDIQNGLMANVDRTLMRTVLENLLGNAWKFSAHRDVTHIAFGATTTEEGETVYFVRDDGAGFDMAYVDKLFDTFQRLHRQDEFEGSGIGLATAQRIVRLHGGRIWAEAIEDKGATFYFTLAMNERNVWRYGTV
jgi:signal transduction histidine kinase